ncbi:DNA (cytosine-5-)-methyltransferase [Chryseobacterium mucoviscidosis]|uniref:DNA (cytosine-5-)-methyltransferase n=1 Tax=Chryseobacterium mucoviscidosis TaxID=1945581 RepID=UPI000EE464C7|nr:restriction endonuclease subunit M [Chryseobacterium sp.]
MEREVTFGSVCSGIEAAQLAFNPFGLKQVWSSEIAEFPCKVLKHHFPNIPNLGDMANIPQLILDKKHTAPDLFCGGTPCQAFSLAGWKNGLADERGQLTMKFIEIANAIDLIRAKENKKPTVVLWENVEGVLNDKTNAFGNLLAGLAGYDTEITVSKWAKSGVVFGKTRNVAWRVIDAKYFGLPQQRKRLYLLAGGTDFRPDQILFEFDNKNVTSQYKTQTSKKTNGLGNLFEELKTIVTDDEQIIFKGTEKFEFFRKYTDCLYSAYGTKWNGNAAAYNGSLYVAQNDRIRRYTPLECERLMGFPDNYTLINGNSDTNRYQAVGNSWAVPVVKWLGERISKYFNYGHFEITDWTKSIRKEKSTIHKNLYLLGDVHQIGENKFLNASSIPNNPIEGSLSEIVQEENVPEKFYLSPQACKGILRRKKEKDIKMNSELERLMSIISEELNYQNFSI